jgi:RNA polymerase-binding transcription factor DksA
MQSRKAAQREANGAKRRAATTQDVLGVRVDPPPIPPKWKKYYERLKVLRETLLGKQGELVEDARQEVPTYSMHMADAGTDNYDRDWALSMLSSEQNAVYEIDEAMDRIRNRRYGICELTGKPIEPERLQAIPWTRFSAEAERELEKNGMAARARLGERGSVAAISRSADTETEEEEET